MISYNFKYNNEALVLTINDSERMKTQLHIDTAEGEQYLDLSTILEDNLLIDAVWIEATPEHREIANLIPFLKPDSRTTKSGFKSYQLYRLRKPKCFYLIGTAVAAEYESGGVEKVLSNIHRLFFGSYVWIEGESDHKELMNNLIGWDKYTEVTEQDYNAIMEELKRPQP